MGLIPEVDLIPLMKLITELPVPIIDKIPPTLIPTPVYLHWSMGDSDSNSKKFKSQHLECVPTGL